MIAATLPHDPGSKADRDRLPQGSISGFWQALATTPWSLLAEWQETDSGSDWIRSHQHIHQDAGLDAQLRQLEALGCDKVFSEQVFSVADLARLSAALEYVREGDTFVVTKLDRLARSVAHLVEIVGALEGKGVALKILDLGMDTNTPTGRLMLTVIGAIAQFEREIMIERQREGIAAARAEGKYRGRAPTARRKAEQIRELAAEGVGKAEIARRLGVGERSVYRMLSGHI